MSNFRNIKSIENFEINVQNREHLSKMISGGNLLLGGLTVQDNAILSSSSIGFNNFFKDNITSTSKTNKINIITPQCNIEGELLLSDTNNTIFKDPLLELDYANQHRDKGFVFKWSDNDIIKNGYFGFDQLVKRFVLAKSANIDYLNNIVSRPVLELGSFELDTIYVNNIEPTETNTTNIINVNAGLNVQNSV
jgi:hypothetical protein